MSARRDRVPLSGRSNKDTMNSPIAKVGSARSVGNQNVPAQRSAPNSARLSARVSLANSSRESARGLGSVSIRSNLTVTFPLIHLPDELGRI